MDDHTRIAFVEVHADERGETCAGFLQRASEHFGSLGIAIEQVMTDNAKNYVVSRAFSQTLGELGAGHITTRPNRPQTYGKVERFNRTLLEEWAYVRLYRSNGARLQALGRWIEFYNSRRPHTALGGRPPISRASTT